MNDGATTRFNNDLKRGAQMQLAGAGQQAAKSSIRPTHSGGNPNGAPVGGPPKSNNHPLQGQTFTPLGAPQAPQTPMENSEDPVARLVQEIHFDKLLNSPEVAEANELENFRDYFHGRVAGPERGSRVIQRLSSYLR